MSQVVSCCFHSLCPRGRFVYDVSIAQELDKFLFCKVNEFCVQATLPSALAIARHASLTACMGYPSGNLPHSKSFFNASNSSGAAAMSRAEESLSINLATVFAVVEKSPCHTERDFLFSYSGPIFHGPGVCVVSVFILIFPFSFGLRDHPS